MEGRATSVSKASLTLLGTIIGAGVFGLPALFSYVGFWPGTLLFWFLAGIMLLTHVYLVEIILAFRKKMRLAGYAREVLGKRGFIMASITYPGQIIGVNLIYIILGGAFLSMLGHGIGLHQPLVFWQLLFWAIGGAIVLSGFKFLATFETIATWFLIGSMVVVIGLSTGSWNIRALSYADWSHFFVPFGVFLFSLFGVSVISEIVELSGRNREKAFRAVTIGTLGAALLSWAFGVSLYLAVGRVGRDPFDLISALPSSWSWLLPVFGILAIITSFVTTAEDLKQTFHFDFHLRPRASWLLALFIPLLLFITQRDFLSTVDFVGTVFGGLNCLLVIFIALKLFAHRRKKSPAPVVWSFAGSIVLLLVFMIGILHKFLYQPLV
ncbi:hypothetical protein FJZ48_01705 [Candidatus Uhrbacteria bacterium]|nr:hypothetical protein [Candidatus Uhrbacteria bacterium]